MIDNADKAIRFIRDLHRDREQFRAAIAASLGHEKEARIYVEDYWPEWGTRSLPMRGQILQHALDEATKRGRSRVKF